MKKFSYIVASQEDVDNIVHFHKKVNTRISVQNIMWEHWGLYKELGVFGILKDGKEIIGTQEFIPISLIESGESHLCAVSERTLLDQRYRGGNNFKEFYEFLIGEMVKQGCRYIYGATYAHKAFRNFGFETSQPLRHIGFIFNFPKFFELVLLSSEKTITKLSRLGIGILSWCLFKLRYAPPCPNANNMRYSISDDIPSEATIGNLISRFQEKYPENLILRYDIRFLRWRILENPFRNYKFASVYTGADLKALAIIDVTNEDAYQIEDLLYSDDCVLDYLLRSTALSCLKHQNCISLHFWGNYTNNTIRNIFLKMERLGGIKYPSRIHFVRRCIRKPHPGRMGSLPSWPITPIWLPTLE